MRPSMKRCQTSLSLGQRYICFLKEATTTILITAQKIRGWMWRKIPMLSADACGQEWTIWESPWDILPKAGQGH